MESLLMTQYNPSLMKSKPTQSVPTPRISISNPQSQFNPNPHRTDKTMLPTSPNDHNLPQPNFTKTYSYLVPSSSPTLPPKSSTFKATHLKSTEAAPPSVYTGGSS